MIASMLDWVAERFQDALAAEEFDPGLIHRKPYTPEKRAAQDPRDHRTASKRHRPSLRLGSSEFAVGVRGLVKDDDE